jgi:hypothetical protein
MDIIAKKNVSVRKDIRLYSSSTKTVRLNIGCGRNTLPGWINIDNIDLPGIDIIMDLESCGQQQLPYEDNSVNEFLLSHSLEHVVNSLGLMQELHRIARPQALAVIRLPFGASDDAFEDPTHVRQYFPGSFGYFSQPFYWRADYGYRGDWQVRKITLNVDKNVHSGLTAEEIFLKVRGDRNVVGEMIVELIAVKPIRGPLKELQTPPPISINLA